MNCDNIQLLLDPLVDNELPTETTAQLMQHIASCFDCQQEWDARINLRERFRTFSTNVQPRSGALDRLDAHLQQQIGQLSKSSLLSFPRRIFVIAAVFVALIGVGLWSYLSFNDPVTPMQIASSFKTPDIGSTTIDLKKVSHHVGFEVNPLKIPGWKLVSADVFHPSQKKQCLAKLTYSTKQNGKYRYLVCYQSCRGSIRPDGLKQHNFNGNLYCCGQIGELSLVYWPQQEKEYLLVGTMPEKQLMGLARQV